MGLRVFSRRARSARGKPAQGSAPDEFVPASAKPMLVEDQLAEAVHLGRLGLIVNRPQLWEGYSSYRRVRSEALQAIDDSFGLVPDGYATISASISTQHDAGETDDATAPYLLGRHAVTNADYQMFVDGGGYRDLELWPESLWPHLIDFVDGSGQPGPRYWKHGRHNRHLADHPVVGVSYYEAAAYALWSGYRLPTEAEWQMAATWCIRSAAHTIRRYPWGDAFDLKHCNIWASGHGTTLPVSACPSGAAPNGVVQLIGNVWEWTTSDFTCTDAEGRTIVGDALLKSIRGGGYDTYFPWQATSSFRTGLNCLLRPHNVGFRCAFDLPQQSDPKAGPACD